MSWQEFGSNFQTCQLRWVITSAVVWANICTFLAAGNLKRIVLMVTVILSRNSLLQTTTQTTFMLKTGRELIWAHLQLLILSAAFSLYRLSTKQIFWSYRQTFKATKIKHSQMVLLKILTYPNHRIVLQEECRFCRHSRLSSSSKFRHRFKQL